MFVIVNWRGHFLAEGSKSRGSQAGIGRIWTYERRRALTFESEAEARRFLVQEFDSEPQAYSIKEL